MNKPTSPFEDIIALEGRRYKLLENTVLEFEEKNIEKLWLDYTEFSIPILDKFNFHIKTLFSRYYDEYEKELESDEASDLDKLSKKIKEVLKLIFENTIVIEQKLNYLDNSSTKLKGQFLNYFVNNEMYKQFIGELFFTTKLPVNTLKEISHIMVNQYKVNQFERILHSIDNNPDILKENLDLVTSAYRTKSEYYLFDVGSQIQSICNNWWWNDYILLSSIYSQAKHHLNSLNELLIESNTRMQFEDSLPNNLSFAMANEIYFKSKLLYENGVKTAAEGTHKQSIRYFTKVMENSEIGLAYLLNKETDDTIKLREQLNKLYSKTKLLRQITKLTTKYNQISSHIITNDKKVILDLLSAIKREASQYVPELEVKYLSALPDMYNTLASTIELLLSLGKEFEELSEEMSQRLIQFISRLDVAISQLIKELNSINQIDDYTETVTIVKSLLKDIDILYETASLIPKNIIERISIIRKLQILKFLVLSIFEDLQSFKYRESNNIRVLIHKAKANFFARKSIEQLFEQKSTGLPVERIYAQYSGSLITGYQKEIEIYELNIQFLCINDILPKFLLYLTSNDDINVDKLKILLWEDELFISMVQQVNTDCNKLINHRQTGNANSLAGVNWDTISNKMLLVESVLPFYESIKYAILASISSKNKKYDDATNYFTLAQDNAFKASEPLKMGNSSLLGEYHSHLFSFAQFCQESSNKTRNQVAVNLPVQEVVKLFRDMIFNM